MPDQDLSSDRPVRVVALTTDRDGSRVGEAFATTVPCDETIEVGREGDLQIADSPEDLSISRVAVRLRTLRGGAMELAVTNANGVAVHAWGARTRYLGSGAEVQQITGLTGLRIIGSSTLDQPDVRVYWVLVEANASGSQVPLQRSVVTVVNEMPLPLTDIQRETVRTVFAEHLAWPPLPRPMSLPIDAAARRLGISAAGVNDRLAGVRKKANALGMAQQFGVADPEYVHVLVAHGYLEPSGEPIPAEDLDLFV